MINKAQKFLEQGFVIQDVEDPAALEWISRRVCQIAQEHLQVNHRESTQTFFDQIANHVSPENLNELRLAVINTLTDEPNFHDYYFKLATKLLHELVGNELAIQRNLGLNIQLPQDKSSLLAPHSDVWGSECSPFEIVIWLPLVDCWKTKSLFILPPEKDLYWRKQLKSFNGMDQCYEEMKNDVQWVDVNYGQVLAFTPTLLHGNRINEENTTRWSFNIRFKGLFTPYAGKGFGEYFQPLNIRPISRIGMEFDFPRLDDES